MPSITLRQPGIDARLVNRLTTRNYSRSACLRFHQELGFIRVSVMKLRYFDRGAGGFMGGGAWVNEGHVFCHAMPANALEFEPEPVVRSVAGWTLAPSDPLSDQAPSRGSRRQKEVSAWNDEFWTLDEALAYANGETNTDFATLTEPVRVRMIKGQLTLRRG